MNTLPATEIKRRGVVAIEECLKNGPLHIIKNNRPTYVVLSEEQYARLLNQAPTTISNSLWELLDHRSWEGKRTKKSIDAQIKKERKAWRE